jgi:polyferredoxin
MIMNASAATQPSAFRRPSLSIFRFRHILSEIMWSLFKEFLKFCKQEKKWWLIPLIVLLLVLGAILLFTASSGIAWALYPFM